VRIAQVAPVVESVPPFRYGGTERVVAAVVGELVALGHEVTLYASGDSATEARLIPIVEQALWRGDAGISEVVVHLSELGRVVREADDYDVIHSHIDVLGFSFGRLSSTPFVHTMHGRMDSPELQALGEEFPDAPLVSISNNQRRPLPNANWIATVYNGVPIDTLPFGAGAGRYLAFLGRISPEKGIADAIDVAIQAGIPLKIAARKPLESVSNEWVNRDWVYYNEEVKPRMSHPLVEFVGEVGDAEKGEFLKDAIGLLFPINWPEPFGLAMAEALACGTPVIARPKGSVPEVIEHGRTGFICPDIEAMVEACQHLDQLSRAECRRVAEDRFSARAMAEGYLRVYQTVTHKPAVFGLPFDPIPAFSRLVS
jgi:glycosyltransferase involved in cell wall biosynthesis